MEVTGGSLVISGNAKISVTDLTIRITQGSIVGTGDSTLIFVSSQISIEGGNFVLNGTSEGRLLKGTIMRITGGTVKKAPTATFIMDKGSKIFNGKEIVGGGAYVMPEDSGLDVTEKGEMNINSNSEFRSGSDNSKGSVRNFGSWNFQHKKGHRSKWSVPFENHNNLNLRNGGIVDFERFSQKKGQTYLEDNTELSANRDFDVEDGEVQVDGKGRIKGKVRNKGLLKAASNKGLLLDIDGDFDHDGEIEADINDEKQPGKDFTRINVKGRTKFDSKSTLNLCIKKKFNKKTRIELIAYKSSEGRFKNIKLNCKGKSKRDLDEYYAACPFFLKKK
jgi:hypothetical protein